MTLVTTGVVLYIKFYCALPNSKNTHSYPDVADDKGRTPLDLAMKWSTAKCLDKDKREVCTEIVQYLKSLKAKHSK